MSPYVFPGLPKPKSKLFFDLQAMIAENKGRLHLANVLECEAVKEYLPAYSSKSGLAKKWELREIEYLRDNRSMKNKQVAANLNRTYESINQKIYDLIKAGYLGVKR